MKLVDQIRSRCGELHDLEIMEPEEVYEQVAREFDMDVEKLYELLAAD